MQAELDVLRRVVGSGPNAAAASDGGGGRDDAAVADLYLQLQRLRAELDTLTTTHATTKRELSKSKEVRWLFVSRAHTGTLVKHKGADPLSASQGEGHTPLLLCGVLRIADVLRLCHLRSEDGIVYAGLSSH